MDSTFHAFLFIASKIHFRKYGNIYIYIFLGFRVFSRISDRYNLTAVNNRILGKTLLENLASSDESSSWIREFALFGRTLRTVGRAKIIFSRRANSAHNGTSALFSPATDAARPTSPINFILRASPFFFFFFSARRAKKRDTGKGKLNSLETARHHNLSSQSFVFSIYSCDPA